MDLKPVDQMDDNLSVMRACQSMITAWKSPPNMLYVRNHLLPRYFKAQADAIGWASR